MYFAKDIKKLKELRWLKCGIYVFAVFICVFQVIEAKAAHNDILAFGDSITQGVKIDSDGNQTGITSPGNGARTSDGYEPELEALFGNTVDSAYVYNWGYGGERTDAGLNRIDSVLASRQAQYILIMEGTNDILGSISTQTTKFNLSQMVAKSRDASVEPILGTVPPFSIPGARGTTKNALARELNAKIKQLALDDSVVLADQYSYLSPPPDETGWETTYNSGDGIHLSDEGQVRVAQTWFDALVSPLHYPAGLVSYWTLDENGVPTFVDSTGLNKGQCTDKCPQSIAGLVDGGQSFNGNSRINVAYNSSFDWGIGDSFSIEFWMRKSVATTENEPIVARNYSSGLVHWWVGVDHVVGPEKARFFLRDSIGNAYYVLGSTVLTDGAWHHIVGVRDAVNSELRIYVDGVLEGTTPTLYGGNFVAPSTPVTIGYLVAGNSYDFNGNLDEVAIYNRVLSEDEISDHLDNGNLGKSYFEGSGYAPKITSTAPASVALNSTYEYDVDATGYPAASYILDDGPSGMVINSATGVLQWTPSSAGTYSVKVIAQNAYGSNSQSFTVEVQDQLSFPSGLVSYWTLDETSGPTFVDSTGLNNGQCTDKCPALITGLVDGGQSFNGNSRVNVSYDGSFDWGISESFSIEFWMRKSVATTENEPIVGRNSSSGQVHWWVGVDHVISPERARFFLRDSKGNAYYVVGTKILTDSVWHHIVGVRDASSSELRIYVDGVLEGTTLTSYGAGFAAPNIPVTIGYLVAGSSYDFNGGLDEVAIYNRVLNLDEIVAHHNNGELGLSYFKNGESAPQITSTPPESVIVNNTFQYDVSAAGSPAPTFFLDSGPSGILLNSATGHLEWTPSASGAYSVKVTAQNDLGTDSQSFTITVNDPLTSSGDFESFMVSNLDENWVTVNLGGTYTSPVVIATPAYTKSSSPLVVRIRNAGASSFQARAVNVNNTATDITGVDVYFFVAEEGVYTQATDGITMEAVRYTSTVTDHPGSWIGQKRTYANSYVNPVVLGQVMSENDSDFSVFWSRGGSTTAAPSSTTFYAGKHVGEDSDTTRANETIGYVVIEAGSYSVAGVDILAALGAASVSGVGDAPPYSYNISGLAGVKNVIVSQSSMHGGNGGWAMLYGATPFTDKKINLAIDEDQIGDSERNHIAEPVAYLAISN